jgi:hypothetical protein
MDILAVVKQALNKIVKIFYLINMFVFLEPDVELGGFVFNRKAPFQVDENAKRNVCVVIKISDELIQLFFLHVGFGF